MLVYSRASRENIERAVAKAREVKPLVKALNFGQFEVAGSKGDSYTVSFRKENGEFVSDCTCRAGQNGLACYHQAAASSIFKSQVFALASHKMIEVEAPNSICAKCGEGHSETDLGKMALVYDQGAYYHPVCMRGVK